MGFRNGAYCTVWGVEDKPNYSNVELSISKKDKETNEYVTEFSSKYVMFCGNVAHNFAEKLKKGDRVKLVSTDVKITKHKGKWNPQFIVYEAEMASCSNERPSKTKDLNPVEESSPW